MSIKVTNNVHSLLTLATTHKEVYIELMEQINLQAPVKGHSSNYRQQWLFRSGWSIETLPSPHTRKCLSIAFSLSLTVWTFRTHLSVKRKQSSVICNFGYPWLIAHHRAWNKKSTSPLLLLRISILTFEVDWSRNIFLGGISSLECSIDRRL